MAVLTDAQIQKLLNDEKIISTADVNALKTKPSLQPEGGLAFKLKVTGKSKQEYTVIARRIEDLTVTNKFSIILRCVTPTVSLNLIRCNGYHGPHENKIEKKAKQPNAGIPRDQFHIHQATERYQLRKGSDAEGYAVQTNGFGSFEEAVDYMTTHFGFVVT